jgi:hypothetical protein
MSSRNIDQKEIRANLPNPCLNFPMNVQVATVKSAISAGFSAVGIFE